jgi:hypothetical protein
MNREVDIEAGPGVFRHFRGYDLDAWTCLGEFVDNSLGSFLHSDTKKYFTQNNIQTSLEVTIHRNSGNKSIRIEDNAGGISESDLDRALKIGDRPEQAKGFNEFGVGMKMAAFWFCPRWTITTKALGETDVKQIIFDVDEIEERCLKSLPVIPIGKESQHIAYTHIELENIYEEHWPAGGKTLTKIKDHLSSIYRRQTTLLPLSKNAKRKNNRHGKQLGKPMQLDFIDNDTVHHLTYEFPEILTMSYVLEKDSPPELWKVEVDFADNHRTIKGWVGLLETTSGVKAGFTLIRRDRVIEGQERSWRPDKSDSDKNWLFSGNTAPRARLFGELDFTGFEVSNNKSKIQWGLDAEDVKEKFLKYLQFKIKYLSPESRGESEANYQRFWNQLLNYTRAPAEEEETFEEFYEDSSKELESVLQYETQDQIVPLEIDQAELEESKQLFREAPAALKSFKFPLNVTKTEEWEVIFSPVHLGGNSVFFDLDHWTTDTNPKVLHIKWDQDHRFSNGVSGTKEEFNNSMPVFKLIAGMCIAEIKLIEDITQDELANGPAYYRQVVNRVLSYFS